MKQKQYALRITHSVSRFTLHVSHLISILLWLISIYWGTAGTVSAQSFWEEHKNAFHTAVISQRWQLTPSETKTPRVSEQVERRLSQVAFPLLWRHTLSSNTWLYISQSNATMQFNGGERDESLSGLGNTKFKFAYEFPENRVRLTAGLSLPTGKNRLAPIEVDVANQFYSEVLGFRVNRLGEGVDFHFSAAITQPIAALILSGGAGYLRKGSYEILEDVPRYNPGNQFQIALGSHWSRRQVAWQSNFAYTNHTADRFDDQIWFEQGAEVLIDSRVRWGSQSTQFELLLREILRGKNRLRSAPDELSSELFNTNGNRRQIAVGGRYNTSPIVQIHGAIEYQATRANEKDEGKSRIWQFTLGAGFQMTDTITAQVGSRLATGEMFDGTVDLRGFGMWIGVSSGFME